MKLDANNRVTSPQGFTYLLLQLEITTAPPVQGKLVRVSIMNTTADSIIIYYHYCI